MSNNCLKLSEYETVNISDGAFKLTPNEVDKFERLNEKLKSGLKTGSNLISFTYKQGKAYSVTAPSSYVGLLRIGSKTIQIIPKLSRNTGNNTNDSLNAIRNLLYMLSYTKRLAIKETDISGFYSSRDDFFEILIYLLAKNLLDLSRSNINRQYVSQEENLPFIKGKLQIGSHIRKNIATRHKFYLEFDEFCEDNLINQIFKYTIISLLRTTKDISNRKLLQELYFIFSDISLKKIILSDFNSIHLTRLTQAYEPALNLCKLFIGNNSIEMNTGILESYSFIFDMNLLFEEFIGEFIKKNFGTNFSRITLQKPCRWLVERKISVDRVQDNIFRMIPDIQFYENKYDEDPKLIIDTKYKILKDFDDTKEGVSQGDLYQMSSYSKKFNCQSVILLYPKGANQNNKDIQFIIDNNTSVHIRTVDLCRDLKTSVNYLKEELENILKINS